MPYSALNPLCIRWRATQTTASAGANRCRMPRLGRYREAASEAKPGDSMPKKREMEYEVRRLKAQLRRYEELLRQAEVIIEDLQGLQQSLNRKDGPLPPRRWSGLLNAELTQPLLAEDANAQTASRGAAWYNA